MKCPSCGMENNDQAVFCSSCGTRLDGCAPQAAPQQPIYQQADSQQTNYQQPNQQRPIPDYLQPTAPAPKKKSKKGCGIAAGIVAAIVVVLIIIVAALGGEDDATGDAGNSSAGSNNAASAQQDDRSNQQGKGTIDDYAVEIKDATLTKDYAGKDAIAITYGFTNNSDEAISFTVAVTASAYQDGVELQSAIADMSSDIDAGASLSNVKPGASTDITVLYGLSNTTSDVEVEITDLFDLTNQKVVKTFTLAE